MRRLVFFGMDGSFSTVPLAALASGGLAPVLVVQGLMPAPAERRAQVELQRSKPGWLARLVGQKDPYALGAGATGAGGATGGSDQARSWALGERSLDRAARALEIDVLRTSDANAARARAHILGAEPEAFVVAGFPHLLSRELLALARRGGLNVHPGKLPDERGPAPLFWALRRGEHAVHFTIHMLDEGEDSGDIVFGGEVGFEPGEDSAAILGRSAQAAAPHLIRALRGLLDGDLVRSPQPKQGHGRCPRPGFRDGMIDAGRSAREVFAFVGGWARTHSLFAECGGDRFFIKEAVSFDDQATLAFEYALTGDRLILRCSPGVVELTLKEHGALFAAEYRE